MFATVMCLVLPMCSSVLCELEALGMFDEFPSLFVLPVCVYGGVVLYFWCFWLSV